MRDIINKIYEYSLEDIMGDRFGRYAKAIIQDRALPDVRDGLKPVQRRILYTMYKDNNTIDKPRRKCAKTVGDVMGSYHPHGDTSIYDAMVRMSQWWKQNAVYIDFKGNNGSLDGDVAAAYRYTEARLSKISNELLNDINKNTVTWAPNYDDTKKEPTVLPVKFPVILVNGSSGISAGYATNIPPHNLSEVIDGTIKRIDNPNSRLDTIMEIIKGPDFPTGGVAEGLEGIKEAFETGKGRVILKAKYTIEKNKIIITEIPYDVNKALLVKKISDIIIDKKVEGMIEVRDESDLNNPATIVIDLKKDANTDLIINYLLKNTDLQISFNYNMVAIVNNRPVTLGLLSIIDAYIKHLELVITRRTEFDLNTAKTRMHIVEGLIKMLSILDSVIATIRKSKNKSDAIINLVNEYSFTEKQAEAIVSLQLYRLTNTDVTELEEEFKKLGEIIKFLTSILNNDKLLKSQMKEELRRIKKEYGIDRRTLIKEEITEIKIDNTLMVPKENCIVAITKQGYVKRVTIRGYNANEEDTLVKEGDYVIGLYEINTLDTILMFTDLGNYLYVPVHEIPDLRWRELGKHISNIVSTEADENIISCIPVTNFEIDNYVTLFSEKGLVKRTKLSEFKVQRYSKTILCMKLKDNDKVVSVINDLGIEVFIATENGYGLRYNINEISPIGLRAAGVKAINLKDDKVVCAHVINTEEYITVITKNGTGKRIKLSDFDKLSRARKGVLLIRDVKTNPYKVLKTFISDNKNIGYIVNNEINYLKTTELPIVDRYSTGTVISKKKIDDAFLVQELYSKKESNKKVEEEIIDINLENVDKRIMTIDDFLGDLEL